MSSEPIRIALAQLRNTRDWRAELLRHAFELTTRPRDTHAVFHLHNPQLSDGVIEEEWRRALALFPAEVSARMTLTIDRDRSSYDEPPNDDIVLATVNFRHEVLRRVLTWCIEHGPPMPYASLLTAFGGRHKSSLRLALHALVEHRLLQQSRRGFYQPFVPALTRGRLSEARATPQRIRLANAQLPAIDFLARRLDALARRGTLSERKSKVQLSGVTAARERVPQIDLVGAPRLDLLLEAPLEQGHLPLRVMHDLDAGLEIERHPLNNAPVVVTICRTFSERAPEPRNSLERAQAGDIFLSLIDMELYAVADDYASGIFAKATFPRSHDSQRDP